ncbi:CAP domain [Dillenia turbinata]|uniref:CAP domain n=1 Tax=Dillenia turbinata TaxID=194707 RepID=A0AAN8ZQ24_9MAGN
MGWSKIFFVLISLITLALTQSSLAQNFPQDYLNTHNAARAEVGVGPLTWDNTVAAYAQNYANQRAGDCAMQHSGGPYGENLAAGSGDFTGVKGVQLWVNEKSNYDYNSNSCVGGQCLHYTQVVWRNSSRLGCARVQCSNSWWFVTCNYDPPAFALIQSTLAQNSPQDYLDAHNAARAEVGVGPLTWDDTVAAYAQNYANQRAGDCALQHSDGPYGENLAAGSGGFTGVKGVQLWVNEKSNYDYNSNSCVGGECLHYTQVVWRNSNRLGCARVQCSNGWCPVEVHLLGRTEIAVGTETVTGKCRKRGVEHLPEIAAVKSRLIRRCGIRQVMKAHRHFEKGRKSLLDSQSSDLSPTSFSSFIDAVAPLFTIADRQALRQVFIADFVERRNVDWPYDPVSASPDRPSSATNYDLRGLAGGGLLDGGGVCSGSNRVQV